MREARTRYYRLATTEIPVQIEGYPTSRYSVVALYPETGRKHQLRRHMKHVSPPRSSTMPTTDTGATIAISRNGSGKDG
jgi:hypothetical protein